MHLETFHLLDRLSLAADATAAEALAVVPEESSILAHHFPGHPVLPGVFQIETAAQTAGYLALTRNHWQRMPILVCVDKARFRQTVAPGDRLQVRVSLIQSGSAYCAVRATINTARGCAADLELRLRLVEFPSPVTRQMLLQAFLGLIVHGRARDIGLEAIAGTQVQAQDPQGEKKIPVT